VPRCSPGDAGAIDRRVPDVARPGTWSGQTSAANRLPRSQRPAARGSLGGAIGSRARTMSVPPDVQCPGHRTLNLPRAKGPGRQNSPIRALSTPSSTASKHAYLQAPLEMARPGIEPGTSRFSGTSRSEPKNRKSPANQRVRADAHGGWIRVDKRRSPWLKDLARAARSFSNALARVRLGPKRGSLVCDGVAAKPSACRTPPASHWRHGPRQPRGPRRLVRRRPCPAPATGTDRPIQSWHAADPARSRDALPT